MTVFHYLNFWVRPSLAGSVRFIILAIDLVVFLYTKIYNIFILNLLKVGYFRVSTACNETKEAWGGKGLHTAFSSRMTPVTEGSQGRDWCRRAAHSALLSLPSHSVQDHYQPIVGLSSHTNQQSRKGTTGQSEVWSQITGVTLPAQWQCSIRVGHIFWVLVLMSLLWVLYTLNCYKTHFTYSVIF